MQGEWRQSCKESGDSRARRVETAVQGEWRQPCKEGGGEKKIYKTDNSRKTIEVTFMPKIQGNKRKRTCFTRASQ